MANSFVKEAYEVIYKHPDWQKEATAYEEKLAAKLFHNSYTKNAVKTALGKISRILTDYYGDGGKTFDKQQREEWEVSGAMTDMAEQFVGQNKEIKVNKTLVAALMQERHDNKNNGQLKTSAGQVPRVTEKDWNANRFYREYTTDEADLKNMQTLDAVMNVDGNLREQMTLLYNGMFINGGRSTSQIKNSTSLKRVFMEINRENAAEKNSEDLMGIDFELLEGQGNYQNGKDVFDTYHLARDLERRNEKREGIGNSVSRWWRGIKRAFSAAFGNHYKREKLKGSKVKDGLGLKHYDDLGIGLSRRERELSVIIDSNMEEKLMWKEGASYATPKVPITANGMRQTAGTSGTTLRMLGAYRLMGASQKELLDFRLALIAWMVSSRDHSLYEILKGSHNAGVKGTEDLSEAVTMYMNIDPLDTDILREQFTENGEFPHEKVFKKQVEAANKARIDREKSLGVYEERSEQRLQYRAITEQMEVMQGLVERYWEYDAYWEKQLAYVTDYINRLVYDETMDTVEEMERARELQREYTETLTDLREEYNIVATQYNEILERRQRMEQEAPWREEISLFTSNNVSYGYDVTKRSAQDIALNIYTTEAYHAMNVGTKWGGTIGKGRLKSAKGYRGASKEEYKNSKILDQIYNVTRVSARMVQDALEERGTREHLEEETNETQGGQMPRYMYAAKVNTFRGEKSNGSKYQTQDYEYETGSLTSSSKALSVALGFLADSVEANGYDNSVLVLYQLNGHGAVDITDLSRIKSEEEVLIPAGTRFRVEKSLVKNVPLDAVQNNVQNLTPDSVTDEEVKAEWSTYLGSGRTEGGISHVNVVRMVEVDGPGSKKRRKQAGETEEERQRNRQRRERLLASFR